MSSRHLLEPPTLAKSLPREATPLADLSIVRRISSQKHMLLSILISIYFTVGLVSIWRYRTRHEMIAEICSLINIKNSVVPCASVKSSSLMPPWTLFLPISKLSFAVSNFFVAMSVTTLPVWQQVVSPLAGTSTSNQRSISLWLQTWRKYYASPQACCTAAKIIEVTINYLKKVVCHVYAHEPTTYLSN